MSQPFDTTPDSKLPPAGSPPSVPEKAPSPVQRRQVTNQFPPPALQRESSSSIASNLASARGIPSNRQRRGIPASADKKSQNVSNRPESGGAESRLARITGSEQVQDIRSKKSLAATNAKTQNHLPKQPTTTPSSRSDEPFQRFYATFESLFSKLSAPLAFAGLPLSLEEPPPPSPQPKVVDAASAKLEERATTEPDLTKIYSKATLRAVREEHGVPGGGGAFGGAESFYVVPTTGGTISYADILVRTQQEVHRQNSNVELPDDHLDDEFVDARETPQPASPALSRRPKPGAKTMEELTLENEALRALADHVSRRLVEFEMGAQTSSLALQRSIRAMQNPTGTETPGGSGGVREKESESDAKVGALEEQIRAKEKELERMGRENEKLKGVVGRYRERWEKLKEGARVRWEGTGDSSVG